MKLVELYMQLVGLALLGFILGGKLPKLVPTYLGHFLFWIGVPISIFAFLRQADLSESVWIAPLCAWIAIVLGAGLAWAWIKLLKVKTSTSSSWSQPVQGSFLLSSMLGNTGYIGYPVTLAVVGTQYFGWALFYDLLGSTIGAYGLGVVLAARFGKGVRSHWQLAQAIIVNPALWSFGIGLLCRQLPLPSLTELSLQGLGWAVVILSLVLIGMRLRQLNSWHSLPKASISLVIKMLLVPLIVGSSLSLFGITGSPRLVIVLQLAMPPAFATLFIAEAYDLDRDLSVTALAVGSTGILLTLPIWLGLFANHL